VGERQEHGQRGTARAYFSVAEVDAGRGVLSRFVHGGSQRRDPECDSVDENASL
jgi:hypothetical protein